MFPIPGRRESERHVSTTLPMTAGAGVRFYFFFLHNFTQNGFGFLMICTEPPCTCLSSCFPCHTWGNLSHSKLGSEWADRSVVLILLHIADNSYTQHLRESSLHIYGCIFTPAISSKGAHGWSCMEKTSAAMLYFAGYQTTYASEKQVSVHFAAVVVVHLHPSHCVVSCTTAALHCAEVCFFIIFGRW